MQWTAQLFTQQQAFCQRSAIVCAVGSRSEELIAPARHDHFIVAHLPLNHRAIRKAADRNSFAEI
jgi:hypothetical protein